MTRLSDAANWAKDQEKWFHSRMNPHDLVESKRCILLAQRNALLQQLRELDSLVRNYREKMHKCPISGRSTGLEDKLEEVVKCLGLGHTGLVDLSAQKVPMDKVVDMVKLAKSEEDGRWLLQLLEGGKSSGPKTWLTPLVEAGGLEALAPWLCDDASLEREKSAQASHPGVLSDSMLPQLMRVLSHIDWSQPKKASQRLVDSQLMKKLQKRVSDTGEEGLRDQRQALKKKASLELKLKEEDKAERKKAASKGIQDSKSSKDDKARDKRKAAEGARATDPNKSGRTAAQDVDLFGSMFGSKDKKRTSTGGALSAMRTVAGERVQLIDDADGGAGAGKEGVAGVGRGGSRSHGTLAAGRAVPTLQSPSTKVCVRVWWGGAKRREHRAVERGMRGVPI